LYWGPATIKLNRSFLRQAIEFEPDLVWVEMGRSVFAGTLRQIKDRLGCLLINSYSDDFMHKRSRHYNESISLYDHIFTPRDVNIGEYHQLGAKSVSKFWKGFDPETHFSVELTPEERKTYGSDVVFVGHCEKNRVKALSKLAARIEDVKVWGPGWNRHMLPKTLRKAVQYRSVWNEEYRRVLCGARIAVNYLSRWNRDTQASKSFEIPACGTFMLSERTEDLLASFDEDREAVFFSSTEELLDKTRFYLGNDRLRKKIAIAGRQRCLQSGYSNYSRMQEMMKLVTQNIRE
jgi:spore maturation protein CgeB